MGRINNRYKRDMKQTAVEWLAEQIITVKWKMSDVTDRNSIIEQAKEMEKEQNDKAYEQGVCAFRDAFYEIIKSK